MQRLYQLLYTSELALEQSLSCVAGIIRVSRVNNAHESITGLLVFDGIHFCQYLEGPRDAVIRVADRIADDNRHILFSIHEQGTLSRRRFACSNMAYALSKEDEAIPNLAAPDIRSSIERLELLLPALSHMLNPAERLS